jgi:hypothetical protein
MSNKIVKNIMITDVDTEREHKYIFVNRVNQ